MDPRSAKLLKESQLKSLRLDWRKHGKGKCVPINKAAPTRLSVLREVREWTRASMGRGAPLSAWQIFNKKLAAEIARAERGE